MAGKVARTCWVFSWCHCSFLAALKMLERQSMEEKSSHEIISISVIISRNGEAGGNYSVGGLGLLINITFPRNYLKV